MMDRKGPYMILIRVSERRMGWEGEVAYNSIDPPVLQWPTNARTRFTMFFRRSWMTVQAIFFEFEFVFRGAYNLA